MKFVDESNNLISENTPPDSDIWEQVRTEEVYLETGGIEIVMHCRKYAVEEQEIRDAAALQKRMSEQVPIAIQLLISKAKFSDEDALLIEALYPEWAIGNTYAADDICRYKNELYRALQNSISDTNRSPGDETLWKRITKETGAN